MGNPLAEQQWIHSGAPCVCVCVYVCVCLCVCVMHIEPVLLYWGFSALKLHGIGIRYRAPHMFHPSKRGHGNEHARKHTEVGGRVQVSKKERTSCFSCVISGSANTHTRLLVIRSFPTLLWYKAPHQDGRMKRGTNGRKYRGMEGQPSAA